MKYKTALLVVTVLAMIMATLFTACPELKLPELGGGGNPRAGTGGTEPSITAVTGTDPGTVIITLTDPTDWGKRSGRALEKKDVTFWLFYQEGIEVKDAIIKTVGRADVHITKALRDDLIAPNTIAGVIQIVSDTPHPFEITGLDPNISYSFFLRIIHPNTTTAKNVPRAHERTKYTRDTAVVQAKSALQTLADKELEEAITKVVEEVVAKAVAAAGREADEEAIRKAVEKNRKVIEDTVRDAIEKVKKTKGPKGDKGDTGRQGAGGATGPAGADGKQGPAGPAGSKGTDGLQGASGKDGAAGTDGATGPAGARGADGKDGTDGARGLQGAAGKDGAAGPAGAKGDDGDRGPAGARGLQGQRGADGLQGTAGRDGTDGARGLQGQRGADGKDGLQGASGKDGATGAAGKDGAAGARGQTGLQGNKGDKGDTGPTNMAAINALIAQAVTKAVDEAGKQADQKVKAVEDKLKTDLVKHEAEIAKLTEANKKMSCNRTLWLRGQWCITTIATGFNRPQGIAIAPDGNTLYVADTNNNNIRKITLPSGKVSTIAGGFNRPQGIAIAPDGNTLYVANTKSNNIRKIALSGSTYTVIPISGNYSSSWIAATSDALYIGEKVGNNTHIKKIALKNYAKSTITTLRKSTVLDTALAKDALYITHLDILTNNYSVRKIALSGGRMTTVATVSHYATGMNFTPKGIALAPNGTLYATSSLTSRITSIIPKGTKGVVTIIAGSSTAGKKDGIGTKAQFNKPSGIAAIQDKDGNTILYVADTNNNRIRKLEYKE